MNLKKLAQSGDGANALDQDQLRHGEPLVVRLDEVLDENTIGATLLVDALHTREGTKVTVRGAPSFSGRDRLANAIVGDERFPPSRAGDVMAFSGAYAKDGVALVSGVVAREHDGLVGRVQVMSAMARASQSKVTKRGPSHFLTIADGSSAKVVDTIELVIAELRAAASRPWPGGSAGLLLRDRQGATVEYFLGFERDEAYLAEQLESSGALSDDRLEVIPAWRVSMGRDQMLREVDPRNESPAHSGPVTRQFEHADLRGRQGFVPCLIVACDEEEWAFGGKTGKRHRVISGVQPIGKGVPLSRERLPTKVRGFGGRANGIISLYDDATMERNSQARAERRPPEPEGTAQRRGGRPDQGRPEREADEGTSRGFTLRRR